MSYHLRQLLRKPFSHIPFHPLRPRLSSPRRFQSSSSTSSQEKSRARIDRLLSRLPKFLRPYTDGLRNAPVSHVVSFLILHEITAIVPLVGLAGLFHYTQWLPAGFVEGRWVKEGMERFGRYFGRKGWFGFSREGSELGKIDGQGLEKEEVGDRDTEEGMVEGAEKRWHVSEAGGRILVEVATAYAITKVLLPVRILVSVWGTPWFARAVLGRVKRVFGRKGS